MEYCTTPRINECLRFVLALLVCPPKQRTLGGGNAQRIPSKLSLPKAPRAGRETVHGAGGQAGDDVRVVDGEGEVGVTV